MSTTAVAERTNHSVALTRQITFQDVFCNLEVYVQIAQYLSKSNKTGDIRSVDSVMATLIQGAELGFPPMTAINCIHPIGNKLSLAASAAQALVIRDLNGKFKIEESKDRCKVTLSVPGRETYTAEYSMDDARLAELVKQGSGWERNPKDMLFSKAMLRACRRVAPDALYGMYSPEEMDGVIDIEPIPESTRTYKSNGGNDPPAETVIDVESKPTDKEPAKETPRRQRKAAKPKDTETAAKSAEVDEPTPAESEPVANDATLLELKKLKESNQIGNNEWLSLLAYYSPEYKSARSLKQSEAMHLMGVLRKRLTEDGPEKN